MQLTLKNSNSSPAFANEYNDNILTANVVVRIPPPTELGDAPININILINKSVGCDNSRMSIVASPPLRVVTDWNNV